MELILSIVQVGLSVALIFLVLMHSGKDSGLSGAFGVGTGAGPLGGGSLVERNLNIWTVVVALLFALLPSGDDDAFPASGLPDTSQSARVQALLDDFPSADATAGVLVWSRGGAELSADDLASISSRSEALAALSTTPEAVRPQVSDDGAAALVAVPLSAADVDADLDGVATSLRDAASAGSTGAGRYSSVPGSSGAVESELPATSASTVNPKAAAML